MSTYVNRNVRGKWEKVEVTDVEVDAVAKRNFVHNMNTAIECVVNVRTALHSSKRLEGMVLSNEFVDKLTLSIIDKMLKPLHYDIENSVDEALYGKENKL